MRKMTLQRTCANLPGKNKIPGLDLPRVAVPNPILMIIAEVANHGTHDLILSVPVQRFGTLVWGFLFGRLPGRIWLFWIYYKRALPLAPEAQSNHHLYNHRGAAGGRPATWPLCGRQGILFRKPSQPFKVWEGEWPAMGLYRRGRGSHHLCHGTI